MVVVLLAALPAILGVLLWALVDLEKFVLFAVLAAVVYPASLLHPAGTNIAAVDVLLFVALAAWLVNNSVGNAPDPFIKANPLVLPGLIFVGIVWISLLWTSGIKGTVSFGFQSFELALLFPIVFASLPRSVQTVDRGMRVFLAITVVMASALIAEFAMNARAHVVGTYLPGLNKNAAGSFQAAGVVIAYVLQLRATGQSRWPLLAAMAICVGGLLASGSRGAMLGTAVAIFVTSLMLRRGKVASVALAVALLALYLAIIAPGVAQKTTAAGSYTSTTARFRIWKNAVKTIEQHPVLGTGAGTYYDVQYGQGDPNNLFLLTLAEEGIPGVAALVFLLVTIIRLFRRCARLPDERAAALAIAAGGVAISLIVHFQVDVSWTRGATSLAFAMLGLMVALRRLAAEPVLPQADRRVEGAPDPVATLVGSG